MKRQNKKIRLRQLLLLFSMIFPIVVMAQQVEVRGVVTSSEDNQPLIGVSVIENSEMELLPISTRDFSITVKSQDAVLQFSMVGMQMQEIKVGTQKQLKVELNTDAILLDQVVVTGYTTEKKAEITGAVSVVKLSDVSSIPTGNIMSTLQGRLPGVNITTDGQPGGTSTAATIRGVTTINNSAPLYVIDGVQTRANIATLLNANDVESIQVLKDAASASIYGTQAANGVIIITTKKSGKVKGTRVNVDGQITTQQYHTNIPLLNAQQWGDVYWKAYQNDGVQPSHDQYGNGDTVIPEFIDIDKTMPAGDTNWADQVYRNIIAKL